MLEWAGITFGAEDSFRLAKSIKVSEKTRSVDLNDSFLETCYYERSGEAQILRKDFRYLTRLLDRQWLS